ncbi:MAG TPA: PIG-L family deacetylase [Chloroflexota bacterium]|nr:PIG-L family deacetylase [Chloroflexota bacterium]
MTYDTLVVAAHPDDAETQMGGTLAKLARLGQRILLVDLSDGEPTEFAKRGVRATQAADAAKILGVDRMCLGLQDRLIDDTPATRLAVASLIRQYRPQWVYGTSDACVHPDHAAAASIVQAAVFLARLGNWDQVPQGDLLADQQPWAVHRLFFPHCKMEPAWAQFGFAVDVSEVYDLKRAALAAYRSIFAPEDRLLALYEAEDQYFGRLVGTRYAEIFRSHSPLVVDDPTVFAPGMHG